MASIYATTWEGRRFRPEEYALKKKQPSGVTFSALCCLSRAAASAGVWPAHCRESPKEPRSKDPESSWVERCLGQPPSCETLKHLDLSKTWDIWQWFKISTKSPTNSCIRWFPIQITLATLICNAGTLVLIWWKRMDRVIIPFWVDRQFLTGTGHGPVVSSTPTTWLDCIPSPLHRILLLFQHHLVEKKYVQNPPATPSQNRCHASQRGQPCTFQLCIWCQVRIP